MSRYRIHECDEKCFPIDGFETTCPVTNVQILLSVVHEYLGLLEKEIAKVASCEEEGK